MKVLATGGTGDPAGRAIVACRRTVAISHLALAQTRTGLARTSPCPAVEGQMLRDYRVMREAVRRMRHPRGGTASMRQWDASTFHCIYVGGLGTLLDVCALRPAALRRRRPGVPLRHPPAPTWGAEAQPVISVRCGHARWRVRQPLAGCQSSPSCHHFGLLHRREPRRPPVSRPSRRPAAGHQYPGRLHLVVRLRRRRCRGSRAGARSRRDRRRVHRRRRDDRNARLNCSARRAARHCPDGLPARRATWSRPRTSRGPAAAAPCNPGDSSGAAIGP